jgi:small subunit ribosomal protein S16
VAVKIRLMRVGKKKQPTYRIVIADSRNARDGRFIEIIGQYEPRRDPSHVSVDTDRAVHWLRHGAQPTETAAKILDVAGVWDAFKAETGKDATAKPAPKTPKPKPVKEPEVTAAASAQPEPEPEAEAETEPEVEAASETEAAANTEADADAEEPPAEGASE